MDTLHHSTASSAREKVIEHLFIGEVMKHLWTLGHYDFEVLRSETDNAGYDLVLEANGVMRHIQLKSSYDKALTRDVTVSLDLAKKSAGCIIWIWFDPETLELNQFRWFGSEPGSPLPDLGSRVAMHTKRNRNGEKTERPNLRVVGKSKFDVIPDVAALNHALFGI